MALSLRSLLKKLQSGVEAIRKPLPAPIQTDFSKYKSPRVQAAVRQNRPAIQQAQQTYQAAKPANVAKQKLGPLRDQALKFGGQAEQGVQNYFKPTPEVRTRDFVREAGDLLGIQRNYNRGVAIAAPYVAKEQDLPGIVERRVGGVYSKVNPVKEYFNIAGDMPLPGAITSRTVARVGVPVAKKVLSKGAYKTASKSLSEFGPKVLNKPIGELLKKTPKTKAGVRQLRDYVGRYARKGSKPAQGPVIDNREIMANRFNNPDSQAGFFKPAEFIPKRVQKSLGISDGAEDIITQARKFDTPEEFVKTQTPSKDYVTVYHRTNSPIDDFGKGGIYSKENRNEFFVSNKKTGQAEGYGKNVIELRVKKSDLNIDDEFPSGENHYTIDAAKVDKYLQAKSQLTDIWNQANRSSQAGAFQPSAFIPKSLRAKLGIQEPKPLSEVVESGSSIGKIGQNSLEGTAGQKGRELPQLAEPSTTQAVETALRKESQPGLRGDSSSLKESVASPQLLPEVDESVNKIVQALKEAKPLRNKQEALYSAERAKRAARVASVGERVPGEKGFQQQLGQLKGELPKVDFESVRGVLTQPDIDNLFNQVEAAPMAVFQKITTKTGLSKILQGQVPTKSELRMLNEVFPDEFVKSVLAKRDMMTKIYEGFGDALAIPRTLMASVDLSAPLRQGVFFAGRPKQWAPAFKNMFKYFASEEAYQASLRQIKSRPTFESMQRSGLDIMEGGQILGQREERFLSQFAEKLPLVRNSNRAYTGFLNQLRADVYDDILGKAKAVGNASPQLEDSLARFVNAATGRGDLGMFSRAAGLLSQALFSPRLLASRVNLLNPRFYYKLEPTVRKEALKSLMTFAAMGTSVLSIAKLAGADVSGDPRNSDFGKIRVGDTRFDIWGGFQQPIKALSQIISGESVSSTTGLPYKLGEGYKATTRLDIASRFLQSKEAPVISFLRGLISGQNFMGDDFNVPEELIARSLPLVVQDLAELALDPEASALMGVPAIFGVGTQTYGRQDPKLAVTPGGDVKVKGEQPAGLPELISNKLFPSKPTAKEDIQKTIEELKSGEIDPISAKARIRQSVLNEVARKINTDPAAKERLAPLYAQELKKSLKSDMKSVLNDPELTIEEKKAQTKLLIENFKKSIGGLNLQSSAPANKKTSNILPSLGQITGLNGSSAWRWGLDVDLQKGQPIPSPVSGTVIASGTNGGFGGQVKLRGDDGREYWFSHLSQGISPGTRVNAGDVIALGGNTGNVIPGRGGDGSHLDLTVIENGRYVPPQNVASLLRSFG